MVELPFLVVHGAWVWKVVLVILVVATTVGVWRIRVRRARRAARHDVAERTARATALTAGDDVTIAGTLRGGTLAMFEREGAIHHATTGTPYVDCDGTRVDLPAELRIVRGSRERRHRSQPPRGTPAALVAADHAVKRDGVVTRTVLHELVDGDRVTVTGALAPKPTGEEAGYRDTGVAWEVTHGARTATIAATAPRGVPTPVHPVALACFVAIAAFGWYLVEKRVGSAADKRARALWQDARPFTADVMADSWALQLAAAMPGSRDAMIDMMEYFVDERRERSDRGLAFLRAVHRELGTCNASRAYYDHRFEDALAEARRCKQGHVEALSLAVLGEHDQAAAHPELPATGTGVSIAIAAGRWQRAAELADRLAAEIAAEQPATYRPADRIARDAKRVRCMAGLARFHAKFPSEPFPDDDRFCAVARAHTLPAAERLAALLRVSFPGDDFRDTSLSLLTPTLIAIAGGPYRDSSFGDPLVDVVTDNWPSYWLSRFVPDPHAADEVLATELLLDPRTVLARFDRLPERDPHYEHSNRLAIALRTGAPLPEPGSDPYVHPALDRMLAARNGTPPRNGYILGYRVDGCEPRFLAGLDAARAGDGGPLAAALRECLISGDHLNDALFGVLPLVKEQRPALAEAIRHNLGQGSSIDLYFPTGTLERAARNRDLLRLAGDDANAATWQRLVERHATVLADRDRAIALHLWEARR